MKRTGMQDWMEQAQARERDARRKQVWLIEYTTLRGQQGSVLMAAENQEEAMGKFLLVMEPHALTIDMAKVTLAVQH
jgi:hypothetical protein